MRTTPQFRSLGFTGAMRVATALVTMLQLLIVATAPLAERADSPVAAVHIEQAGTSAHHAHGALCALCAASHLVGPPARAAAAPMVAKVAGRTDAARHGPSTAADRLDTQPRAPPA